MLDLARVVGFDWDQGNMRKSADKHAVSQDEAEQILLDPRLLVLEDIKHSQEGSAFRRLEQPWKGAACM